MQFQRTVKPYGLNELQAGTEEGARALLFPGRTEGGSMIYGICILASAVLAFLWIKTRRRRKEATGQYAR